MNNTRKVNLIISEKDYELLQSIANVKGVPMASVIRQSLKVGIWYELSIVAQGRRLFMRDRNGSNEKELIPVTEKRPRMKRAIRDRWVSALRSGRYQQGHGTLRSPREEFCALGVLCDVTAPRLWKNFRRFTWVWNGCKKSLGRTGDDFFGLSPKTQERITYLNDTEQFTFEEIADWIEHNIPVED